MGVINSTTLSTTRSVTRSVKDSTIDGYRIAYTGYFNAADAGQQASEATTTTRDSLDDPKDCTD